MRTVQALLQHLVEKKMITFLGRSRHERRGLVSPIDPPHGSRDDYGKPRTFSMMSGTVRHPRVLDLTERFESTVLSLFRRWTQEVGTLLTDLYGHELSIGDFGRHHAACEARARCSRRARFNDSLRS